MKYTTKEASSIVRLLRYRGQDPTTARRSHMTMKAIAEFLHVSTSKVYRIVKQLRQGADPPEEKPKKRGPSTYIASIKKQLLWSGADNKMDEPEE